MVQTHLIFNFIHRVPDGCTLTSESLLKNVLPFNTMSMAMGLHARVGMKTRSLIITDAVFHL